MRKSVHLLRQEYLRPETYTLLDKHISGGIQNHNADPLALGSHASGTKLALKAR